MDIVTSIQSAITIVGKLREFSKRVEDAEFKMLLADLSLELADAKLEVADLKTELAAAKTEIQKHKVEIANREGTKPSIDAGAYIFEGDSSHYCTACFDTKNSRVRLTQLQPPFDTFGKWECPSCHAILS